MRMGSATSAAASLLKGGGGSGGVSLLGGEIRGFGNSIVSLSGLNNVSGGGRAVPSYNKSHSLNIVSRATHFRRSRSSLSSNATSGDSSTKPKQEEEEEAPASAAEQVSLIKEAADLLDIRVGRILRAWRHEEADSLYVEEVDVGEPEPRIICSGLVNFIPLHHLQDLQVVVLANLKPRNMRGVKSWGMLMAASDASHADVELLLPPEGSLPGHRIWFGSPLRLQNLPPPASPNQIQKKKIWELVQPHLKTDDSCVAMLGEHLMRTSAGVVLCRSLKNAKIS